jgi:hypothetical protein
MLLIGSENRGDWDCAVESDESPAVPYRQGEQINVGNLFGAVNTPVVNDRLVQNAQVVEPKLVVRSSRRLLQSLYDLRGGHRVRVLRLRHDSNAPIFGEWARCPPCCSLML